MSLRCKFTAFFALTVVFFFYSSSSRFDIFISFVRGVSSLVSPQSLHCDLYSTNALHLTTTVLNAMEVVVVVERANFSTFFNAAAAAPQKNISPVIVGGRHRTTTRLSYRQAERDLQRSIFTQPST